MAFCSACGQEVGSASFCPKCGASRGPVAVPAGGAAAPAVAAANPADGVQENVAALLCYLPVVGWIIALILFLTDKRSFVKFHAAQALALYVSLIVIYFALGISMGILHMVHIFFLGIFLYPLIWFGSFLLLVLMMVKAHKHERFKLPVLGDLVEGLAK
jgi:uncharacterized membrane protein